MRPEGKALQHFLQAAKPDGMCAECFKGTMQMLKGDQPTQSRMREQHLTG